MEEDASAMTPHPVFHNPEFAVHVADYDAALAQGLAVSGEDKMYFVRGRLAWLAACLRQLGEHPTTMMDYGGGLGSAPPAFREWLGVTSVVGTDMAPRALDVARRADGSERARFLRCDHDQPNASLDLVYPDCYYVRVKLPSKPARTERETTSGTPTARTEAFTATWGSSTFREG
jgi:hypothetical protein